MLKLIKSSPEVDNWVVNLINENKKKLFSLEGYSVRDEKVTAIFERFESNIDIDAIKVEDIQPIIIDNNLPEWQAKYLFSLNLKSPFYIIIWKERVDKYLILEVLDKNIKLKIHCKFMNGDSFSQWMGQLKGIKVTKGFVEGSRLASIDIELRKYGVPWPGNLDGFIYWDGSFVCIIEFSRTRKRSVKEHDIREFFGEDYNRWKPFEILRKQLNIPAYVILWSTSEDIVKVQRIKQITDNLYFDKEIILPKLEIENFLNGKKI